MRILLVIIGGSILALAPVLGGEAAAAQERDLDEWVGVYRVAPHGTMSLSRFEHEDHVVYLFTDFTDGWRGTVTAGDGDTLRLAPRDGPAPTADPRITLGRDANGPVLRLHATDRPVRVGRKIETRTEPVTFPGEGVELAGEIVLPPGPGPHPGIVFVHGSGPATRNDYREWSWFFAGNGIATLIYDKRGAGGSEGDYRAASFETLAADAAAALRRLRDHPGVDPDRVGLSGGSQGAWVAPIALGMDDGIRFVIPTGGGPITPAEQEIYRRARIVEDAGYPADAVEAGRAVVTLYFDYLGSGGDDPRLAAEVSEAWRRQGGEAWFPLLDLPTSDPTAGEWPEGRRRFARELFFDPRPSVRAISVPALAILGGEDQGFPTGRTADAWRDLVDPRLLELWVLPGVDHGFWVTDDPARGRHQSPRIFAGMLAWIQRILAEPPAAKRAAASPGEGPLEDRLPGLYGLEDGGRLVVDRFDGTPLGAATSPGLFDPSSGTIRALTATSDSTWTHGAGLVDPVPAVGSIVARRGPDGEVREIEWRLGDRVRKARPLRGTRRTRVDFVSDEGFALAGSVVGPTSPGPHPGIVMVHGSGPGGRHYLTYGLLSRWLAGLGFVVLSYDKRGYGDSSGPSWSDATVADLARDAAAGVRYLAGRPDVDPDRVGIWGHSQGGWVGPLAAGMAPAAFLVLPAAPAVDTWTQEIHSVQQRLRAHGASEDDVRRASESMAVMFEAATGKDAGRLERIVEASRDAPWVVGVPLTAAPDALAEWRRTRYDPESVLSRLRTPALVLFGGLDEIVPPDVNAPLWERWLSEADNPAWEVHVFPGADHGLLEAPPSGGHGSGGALAPGVVTTIVHWLAPWLSSPDGSPAPSASVGGACARSASPSSDAVRAPRGSRRSS